MWACERYGMYDCGRHDVMGTVIWDCGGMCLEWKCCYDV